MHFLVEPKIKKKPLFKQSALNSTKIKEKTKEAQTSLESNPRSQLLPTGPHCIDRRQVAVPDGANALRVTSCCDLSIVVLPAAEGSVSLCNEVSDKERL
ncbi:hypothetical protein RRG08_037637 [Elysia crispata]|uniref:Uncharacterized protein n=1 Tax=Elysia crispata TaxID=231223 RepID=A0AAE1CYH1_9GAST|nr:hypothetical protein RRG08_037637 [Elysia crispata]